MRFGLCCLFVEEKISFRTTTAKALLNMTVKKRLEKVSGICLHNAKSLLESVKTVHRLGIGAFRISSRFFPRMTHPVTGYRVNAGLKNCLRLRKSMTCWQRQSTFRRITVSDSASIRTSLSCCPRQERK